MAKEICIVIRSFGRGIACLGSGWDWSVTTYRPIRKGIGRHFMRVGERMGQATIRFAKSHPEIHAHA